MDKLTDVKLPDKKLSDYTSLLPEVVTSVKKAATNLQGIKVIHVNATSVGGGVAEMLESQIPLERDLGLDSHWYVIPPNDPFFEVTKSIHNFMQGKPGDLNEQQKNIYLTHNKLIAKLLDKLSPDILIIHDPQPAAAITFMKNRPKLCVWRCHIDTSTPNEKVWNFLSSHLLQYDEVIFTMKEFVHKDLSEKKINLVTPCIDPLSPKNTPIDKDAAQTILKELGVDIARPLVTQVSRLDPWKDPKGVVDAFVLAKKEAPELQLAFVAQLAGDDPEGVQIADETREYAKGKNDIFFFINLPENARQVNAFQTASDIILQKSLREGFALTVTEAMWKRAVVIGGNIGGIRLQIKDGENGFLANSIEETAEKIIYVIKNPNKMKSISENAHESVKNNFLLPHLLLNHLKLYEHSV